MILRGIDFGHVFTASGTRNFFKEDGWWYHRPWSWAGLRFQGTTFITKTTTLDEHAGNMPLGPDRVTPAHWRPRCIRVYFRKGIALNAVGLSGPGAAWLLKQGRWQRYTEPLLISFAMVGPTRDDRLGEAGNFVRLLRRHLPDFSAPVGLQCNFGCPNAGHDLTELAHEADQVFDVLGELGIPLVLKVSAVLEPAFVAYVSKHAACDAIAVSNAIPWRSLPEQIDWDGLFGNAESPLAAFGGGALSGAPLFPVVREWIAQAQGVGLGKPIIAGGGIQRWWQVEQLLDLGAAAFEIGTVCLLRPRRVRKIVRHVQALIERMIRDDPYCAERRGIIPRLPERTVAGPPAATPLP